MSTCFNRPFFSTRPSYLIEKHGSCGGRTKQKNCAVGTTVGKDGETLLPRIGDTPRTKYGYSSRHTCVPNTSYLRMRLKSVTQFFGRTNMSNEEDDL
eukprot:scaffold32506_cov92-Amphora_coffeaeformis.AAC.1